MMNTQSLYEQRQQFFFSPSSTTRGGLIFCILAGVFTFVGGMYAGEATRTWGSFLFNLFFFFTIALGGIAFAGMQDVIGAKWGRPIMRLHESFATFLPVGAGFFLLFFACIGLKIAHAHEVYAWIKDPSIIAHLWGKRDWLKPGLMFSRDFLAFGLILYLALWQLRLKLKPDLALLRGDKAAAAQLGALATTKLRYWTAPILLLYALTFSLLAFDLTMSLTPTWSSTLWAAWSFGIMMQTLMASLLLFMYIVRATPIGKLIKRQQFHDVGKLMHGFTIFFAYLTYAHVITIWYGNMPEETSFFINRLTGAWKGLVVAVFFLVFIVPLFSLLPKVAKWTAGFAVPICFSILFAQWLVALLVVMPSTTDGQTWNLPWIEVGAFLGFLGIFLSCVFWFARRFPMVSIGDPLLAEALDDAH